MITLAEELHKAYDTISKIEDIISGLFERYEPTTFEVLNFTISGDEYDNSIEIYIKNVMPYPYEPSKEIRKVIYDMGFSIVYWNFYDESKKIIEEIRGYEPRHYKDSSTWKLIKDIGYVDDRYQKK